MASFTAATMLLRLPFRHVIVVLIWIRRRRTRLATLRQAETAATAARWAGQWWPGRAACMEISIAATLGAAMRGCAVIWCVGGRQDPFAAHAWIETDAGPAGEPANPDLPYLPFLRI